MATLIGVMIGLAIAALVVAFNAFGINREFERGVLFRLGRLGDVKGAGSIG